MKESMTYSTIFCTPAHARTHVHCYVVWNRGFECETEQLNLNESLDYHLRRCALQYSRNQVFGIVLWWAQQEQFANAYTG